MDADGEPINSTSNNTIVRINSTMQLGPNFVPIATSLKSVKWTYAPPGIVTINSKGVAKAIGLGVVTVTAKSIYNTTITASAEIVVINGTATGINGKNINSTISIYPNPSSGMLTIYCPEEINATNISLVNILGTTVYACKSKEGTSVLDFNHLAKGIYTLIIQTKTGTVTKGISLY